MINIEVEKTILEELKEFMKKNNIKMLNMGYQGGLYYDSEKDEIIADEIYIKKVVEPNCAVTENK